MTLARLHDDATIDEAVAALARERGDYLTAADGRHSVGNSAVGWPLRAAVSNRAAISIWSGRMHFSCSIRPSNRKAVRLLTSLQVEAMSSASFQFSGGGAFGNSR